MEEPTSPLFRLEARKGVLDLGKCLLNDTHVLRSFRITNLTDAALPVSITTDTPEAVSFQLANENLAGIPAETVLASSLQEERFNNVRSAVLLNADLIVVSSTMKSISFARSLLQQRKRRT